MPLKKTPYAPYGKVGGILVIIYLALTCGFGAIFVYGPILPLMVLWPWLYRRLAEVLSSLWQALLVATLEKMYRVKCVLTGDNIKRHEKTLVIMNHRTRLDWMYFFMPIFSFKVLNRQKISLKAPLKWMPGIGWAMQVAGYLFLDRVWENDKEYITQMLQHLIRLGSKPNYLFFPEGTDLCENTKRSSHRFANKNGFSLYEYVLHPRTTGFVHMVNTLRAEGEIDSVHDVTVAYPLTTPQNETSLILGEYPPEVHFNIKRHKISDLPNDDKGLSEWCQKIWHEKESLLKDFYEPSFESGDNNQKHQLCFKNPIKPYTYDRSLLLWIAVIGWLLFLLWSLWIFYVSPFARWYSLLIVMFYISVGYTFGGVEKLEIYVQSKTGRTKKNSTVKTSGNYYQDIIAKSKGK